jgi:uncharacterized protein (DUF2267 family)
MRVSRLPTAATILDALLDRTAPEDGQLADQELAAVMDPILALHHSNALQWTREDDAREDQADDAMVAAAKREIDQLNISRHGFIEEIDSAILRAINPREGAPLVTESPGMAIDRLSVLVIRLASTEARTASGTSDSGLYAERLPQLRIQLSALEEAIATLFDDLAKGTRRFLAHESLKLYGPGGSEPVC